MLRSELGFTTVVKASGVPGAGLGLFVEGSAPAGAVVAIYPVSFFVFWACPIVYFEVMVRRDAKGQPCVRCVDCEQEPFDVARLLTCRPFCCVFLIVSVFFVLVGFPFCARAA